MTTKKLKPNSVEQKHQLTSRELTAIRKLVAANKPNQRPGSMLSRRKKE